MNQWVTREDKMTAEREVEYFEMVDEDIPTRYMALCVWVSNMTDGDMTVQDVHAMVDDLIEDRNFEGGLMAVNLEEPRDIH